MRCYKNLIEKSVVVNQLSQTRVKLFLSGKVFLSGKIVGRRKIHLTKNSKPIKANLETAEILNDFSQKYKILKVKR